MKRGTEAKELRETPGKIHEALECFRRRASLKDHFWKVKWEVKDGVGCYGEIMPIKTINIKFLLCSL